MRRLIEANAIDIVNYDASEGGGVTDWRRAAALCAPAKMPEFGDGMAGLVVNFCCRP